jgi:4-diphosphocytidyl-2-C-methyl-D-erythritol kinase
MKWEISGKGLKILAPAKVNLTLEILGKRTDGYHEIRSLMQPIALFDTLWISPGLKKTEVHCSGHPELENENNLILAAIRLLEKELVSPLNFSIRLNKRIPVGGGLGGGSSDAAAVLSGVNHLLKTPILPDRLKALASQLGSDVPFFLNEGTVLATGRGEHVESWPSFPSWWYVLVYPEFPISTAWAYRQVKLPLTENKKIYKILSLKYKGETIKGFDGLINHLEPFVLPSFPILEKIKKALLGSGCLQALMSGSGSTVFGIWEEKDRAAQAVRQLKQQGLGRIFLAKGL